ncbi:MAG: hypothetical protein VKK04_03540 [Synechococcales bacterium]|nr:hypothetical protein [Synechococcales bacterium]
MPALRPLLTSSFLLLMGLGVANAALAYRVAPAYLQLAVNQASGKPVLDLPPHNQRPVLYAELALSNEVFVTPTLATPRINESIFPEWVINTAEERLPLEPGHTVEASVRIFDQDEADEDDKVLLAVLRFDPFLCAATLGEQTITGVWIESGSTCIVSVPDVQSEMGTATFTLSAQWLGVSPGG